MKTKTLLLFLAALSLKSLMAADVVLNNFESSTPTVTAQYGATFANVVNPNPTGYNTTGNCEKVGRSSSTNWYVLIQFPVSFTVPANTKQYIHILANYLAQPDISIRINNNTDIRATNLYTNFGQWQDLVFEISGGTTGAIVTNLMILPDIGYNNLPAGQVLNNTDKFGYIDEITLNNNPLPLGTTYLTGNNLYDFEPGTAANITGINTSADANNPVTYPVVNPYQTGMNLTANVGKRTAAATTNYWTGFGFTFANPIQVDVNHKYLHIMMIAPANGQQVMFDVNQGATKVIADGIKVITTANTWQDVVIDVSGMTYISGMYIKCGSWNGTAVGDYYFDEIRIDSDPTPRSNTATALNSAVDNSKIYSSNGNIVIESNTIGAKVTIFNSCGQKVASKEIGTNASILVKNKGIYFVNIGNETTKVIVQ